MRRTFWRGIIALVSASVCLGIVLTALTTTSQGDVTTQLLNLLNAERQALGIPPLTANAALIAAAQRHSQDMAANNFLEHVGSDGSQFWQRVSDAGYNMTAGAENVLSRSDADIASAYNQWRESPGHFTNMVNPVYQEIGVAFAQSTTGTVYFTMVLAARADFVTSTTTPAPTNTNPPTSTPLPPTVTSPAPTLLPTNTIPPTVAVTPASTTSTSGLKLLDLTGLVVRSFLVQLLQTLDTPQVAVLPSPTPAPTTTPTLTPFPTITPVLATPTPIPSFEVRLIYDYTSFTLLNASGRTLYLNGLTFEGMTSTLSIERWQNDFLSAPLEAFPAGGCLQTWDFDTVEILSPPPDCRTRHSWIGIPAEQVFWREGDIFTVYQDGEAVTVCTIRLGECGFNLSDRLPAFTQATPPSVPAATQSAMIVPTAVPTGAADVQLLYSPQAFTLLNTSDGNLNLAGLSFASSSGSLVISAWETDFLSRPLADFPPADCLQAFPISEQDYPPKPAQCDTRHSWIVVNATGGFWLNTESFTVNWNGTALTTCSISAGVCNLDLP
ncbi:MAG: CAP domain-containing protein [bacterium]|nr:CAP domain-containing protein [bacterium]